MPEPPHNPCATCGACCRSLMASVCGYDVWLISTGQRLHPGQFLAPFTEEEGSLDGFRLDTQAPPLGLALDRHGRPGGEQPCIFLMRLGDGNDRCGIYGQRPDVCRVYPMSMWNSVVFQREEPLCPPGSWPISQVVKPAWRYDLQRQHLHFDIYCEVVARWNARVAAAPTGARFELDEYYSYLINVYNLLAALDEELGTQGLSEVQASWPVLPRSGLSVDDMDTLRDQLPWLDYLSRAREVIDSFYPEIARQPMLALDGARWPRAFGRLRE